MKKTKKLSISLSDKKEIIDAVNEGLSYDFIKKKFNLNSSSNISVILKNKDKYLSAYNNQVGSPLRKTLKQTKFENIDAGLKNFIANSNRCGVAINDNVLRAKALEIAKAANQDDFKSSNGYLENFKKRNNILFTKIHGEAGGVDETIVSKWFNEQLKEAISQIDPENIYNGDELGLFWRMQPNGTYSLKDSVCKIGKNSKERMTIFLAANMLGTDKLPILIIGKSEKSRKFHLVSKLNLHYYHNTSAWMTGVIFFDYLDKINNILLKNKRSIIIFVDHCSAHPENISFSNIKVVFLPPNTTSVLQPMDAGVIKCFKGNYRVKLVRKLIQHVSETNCPINTNQILFFEAVTMAYLAWEELNQKTISNCFRHCGFFKAKCLSQEIIDTSYDEFCII